MQNWFILIQKLIRGRLFILDFLHTAIKTLISCEIQKDCRYIQLYWTNKMFKELNNNIKWANFSWIILITCQIQRLFENIHHNFLCTMYVRTQSYIFFKNLHIFHIWASWYAIFFQIVKLHYYSKLTNCTLNIGFQTKLWLIIRNTKCAFRGFREGILFQSFKQQ